MKYLMEYFNIRSDIKFKPTERSLALDSSQIADIKLRFLHRDVFWAPQVGKLKLVFFKSRRLRCLSGAQARHRRMEKQCHAFAA